MPIPDYETIMLPVLRLFADGAQNVSECLPMIREQFDITDEEAAEWASYAPVEPCPLGKDVPLKGWLADFPQAEPAHDNRQGAESAGLEP